MSERISFSNQNNRQYLRFSPMTLINHLLYIHLFHIRFHLCLTLAVNGGSNEYYLYSSMLNYSCISLFRKRVFQEFPFYLRHPLNELGLLKEGIPQWSIIVRKQQSLFKHVSVCVYCFLILGVPPERSYSRGCLRVTDFLPGMHSCHKQNQLSTAK